jgi:hypothetical protein
MEHILASDTAALERPQQYISFSGDEEVFRVTGIPPLHHMTLKGHIKCIEFLSKKGANMNSFYYDSERPDWPRFTALSILGDEKYYLTDDYSFELKVIKALLDNGVKMTGEYSEHAIALLARAIDYGHIDDMVAFLLNYGCPVQILNGQTDYYYPLITIVLSLEYHETLAEALLMCGAKVALDKNRYVFHKEHLRASLTLISRNLHNRGLIENLIEIKTNFLNKLKLCHAFGEKMVNFNDLWKAVRRIHSFLGQNLQNTPAVRGSVYIGVNFMLSMVVEAITMIVTPMSLMCLSRIVVRNAMGRDMPKNIKYLPLPQELKNFMKFKDVVKYIEVKEDGMLKFI